MRIVVQSIFCDMEQILGKLITKAKVQITYAKQFMLKEEGLWFYYMKYMCHEQLMMAEMEGTHV